MNWKRLRLISCVIILNASTVFAFNTETAESTVKYIISPVMEQLGVSGTDGKSTKLPDNVRPSFFGYTFNLYKDHENQIRFSIGSPKMIAPTTPTSQEKTSALYRGSRGNINSCAATQLFFSGKDLICEPVYPKNIKIGDNIGLSTAIRPDGNMITCSSTRQKICGDLQFTPGMCNRSRDFGRTWLEEEITEPPVCPTNDIEVLFVLDGSGSVGEKHFLTVKTWVKDITRKLDLEQGTVTVGVVQYSHYDKNADIDNQPYIVTHIPIGAYSNYASFAAAVDRIELQGYTTYTGQTLRKVVTDFTNTKNYNKITTKQVMILLTDGIATDRELVGQNAQKVRDLGVISYAIGVGDKTTINEAELRLIATGDVDSNSRVFMAENFDGLDAIAKELETEIGGLVLEGETNTGNVSNKMQFGQLGFATTYSKKQARRQRRDVANDFGVNGNVTVW